MTIAAGSRLGSHEVLSRLGAGGMGEVFLAHDTKLKRRVAIKVLPDAYARDPERLSRFHREAQAVAALNHPNIAAIRSQSIQNDREGIFRQRADGSRTAERLTTADIGFVHVPQSASPDRNHLLFTILKAGFGEYTLWVLAMKDRRSSSFGSVQARSMVEAAFSPDGRWVAYSAGEAPESGNRVIQSFVQPFPASGAKYQIPGPTGAARPVWTTKGDAILTGAAINRDSLIPVSTTPQFSFGQPDEIPRGARINGAPDSRRNHDPLPDGRILGVMTLGAGESGGQSAPQVAVVLNWFNELRQRVR